MNFDQHVKHHSSSRVPLLQQQQQKQHQQRSFTVYMLPVCDRAAACVSVPISHLLNVTQTWLSTLTAVCRGDLLTELLESLLTSCPTSAGRQQQHHTAAAALWVEQIVSAYRRSDTADPQVRLGRRLTLCRVHWTPACPAQCGPFL